MFNISVRDSIQVSADQLSIILSSLNPQFCGELARSIACSDIIIFEVVENLDRHKGEDSIKTRRHCQVHINFQSVKNFSQLPTLDI